MKNLNAYLYLKKNNFYSSLKDGKRDKSNGHFSGDTNTYKMFGKYLILILLKIFMIIT